MFMDGGVTIIMFSQNVPAVLYAMSEEVSSLRLKHMSFLGFIECPLVVIIIIEFKYYADGIHSGLTPPG